MTAEPTAEPTTEPTTEPTGPVGPTRPAGRTGPAEAWRRMGTGKRLVTVIVGAFVLLEHDETMDTLYGHFAKVLVKTGQQVKQGELLGYGGDTGESDGKHLHFEIHKNGAVVDPLLYLPMLNSPAGNALTIFEAIIVPGVALSKTSRRLSLSSPMSVAGAMRASRSSMQVEDFFMSTIG